MSANASRLFFEGDRVLFPYKGHVYSGRILEIIGRNTPNLEIVIELDYKIPNFPDNHFRGPHKIFWFENFDLDNWFVKNFC